MGRLRHRRARSDMPEYYPLSPAESPLHTAMPQDDSDDNVCQPLPQHHHHQRHFLGAVASAAAVVPLQAEGSRGAAAAASLSAQRSEPVMRSTGGGLLSREPSAAAAPAATGEGRDAADGAWSPVPTCAGGSSSDAVARPVNALGSPLRHGLTSPAARYRLQQQQQLREAPPASLPAAKGVHHHADGQAQHARGQRSTGEAVVEAVAAYDGSMSPRRLARIQEFVYGLEATAVRAAVQAAAAAQAAGDDAEQQQQPQGAASAAELTFSNGAFFNASTSSLQRATSLQQQRAAVAMAAAAGSVVGEDSLQHQADRKSVV